MSSLDVGLEVADDMVKAFGKQTQIQILESPPTVTDRMTLVFFAATRSPLRRRDSTLASAERELECLRFSLARTQDHMHLKLRYLDQVRSLPRAPSALGTPHALTLHRGNSLPTRQARPWRLQTVRKHARGHFARLLNSLAANAFLCVGQAITSARWQKEHM